MSLQVQRIHAGQVTGIWETESVETNSTDELVFQSNESVVILEPLNRVFYKITSTDQSRTARFKFLAAELQKTIDDQELDWESKYDIGFSIKPIIEECLGASIEWYDPDTTYQEDILAFNRAVQAKLGR